MSRQTNMSRVSQSERVAKFWARVGSPRSGSVQSPLGTPRKYTSRTPHQSSIVFVPVVERKK
jgi:predicted nucleic acid-binding Zn ribbon protein